MQPEATSLTSNSRPISRNGWLFSWPLIVGTLVYLLMFHVGKSLLNDGDTLLHISAGQWILQHGTVPSVDPFSHTMRGAPWIAHEWLSEVFLALAHKWGGWTGVVSLTALVFGLTMAMFTRALLKHLEPIYVLLFAAMAILMSAAHLLARPHILTMPLMIVWTIELVRASDEGRRPRLWMLPMMALWANMHGGFTLGLAMTGVFALEAVLASRHEQRTLSVAKSWGIFFLLAVTCSVLTPYGVKGILFTWDLLFNSSYATDNISEWMSPNFHTFQSLEVWLLGGMALFIYQGLHLPVLRLLLMLGFLHLALKHARYVEFLGLLVPLFVSAPLAAQWKLKRQGQQQLEAVDRFFHKLAQPAGAGAAALALSGLMLFSFLIFTIKPIQIDNSAAPTQAIAAVQTAGLRGPVLNSYGLGGYLIFADIPPFIDGRADMYRTDFIKTYVQALSLQETDGLQKLLSQYKIEWTLLEPGMPAVTLLDHIPEWHRLYADKNTVVHVNRQPPHPTPETAPR